METMTFSRKFVAIVTMLIVCSMYYTIPVTVLTCLLFIVFYQSIVSLLILLFLLSLAFIPIKPRPKIKEHWVWKTWCEYFNLKWIDDCPIEIIDNKKRWMGIFFPHGIVPVGAICAATVFDKNCPGFYGVTAMASIVLRIPFLRQIFGAFHVVDNSWATLVKVLKTHNLSLFPGGIAELFLSDKKKEIIFLQQRKGFVKLAYVTGANLVPFYVFGHTQMFDTIQMGGQFLESISRKMGVSVTFFWGRFFLPIPYQTNVTVIRGSPIEIQQCDNPTQEQIDQTHALVVSELKRLFDKHKISAGPEWVEKTLTVL